jgi:hypothetical protein
MQVLYNTQHKKTRNAVERAFGQLKKRFNCLENIVKVSLERTPSVIIACFVLHNLAKRFHDPDFDLTDFDGDDEVHEEDGGHALPMHDNYYRNLGNT